MYLNPGKLNIIIDGQFGSTGKGLLSSYLAVTNHIDVVITNQSANAGHTFYYHGKKHVLKMLPVSGIISDRSAIYMCAGSIINPKILLTEIEEHNIDPCRVIIHPNAAIITDEDIQIEQNLSSSVAKIASTMSGVGSALVRKINRSAKLAKDTKELSKMVDILDLHYYMDQECTCLFEMPQGFDLSLNGPFYPHCTSRDITISAALNDAQVHPNYLGKVAVCLRTYPIRVGNVVINGKEIGYSGPFYDDSVECNWSDIGVEPEMTTVTKRIRRVATFSIDQYRKMLDTLRPDYILLNFANYLSKQDLAILLDKLPEITHLGFGPTYDKVFLNHGHFIGD